MTERPVSERPHSIDLSKGGRTKQQFKEECDVNRIMKKWEAGGGISHIKNSPGNYGDFTSVSDYLTALTTVNFAQEAFDHLPAEIRDRMGNDPRQLLLFMENPENEKEAIELGLLKAPEPDPSPAEPAATPAENAPGGGET